MQSWQTVDYCTINPLCGGGGRKVSETKTHEGQLAVTCGLRVQKLVFGRSVEECVVRGCVFWRHCARFHCWRSCACECHKSKLLGPRACARNVFARVRE
jgi:hypothetical protein